MARWLARHLGYVFCCMALCCSADSTVTASTLLDPDPASKLASQLVTEAYRRIGLTLEVQPMPGERSLVSADTGATDGELYRREGINKQYANLLPVPVALMQYEIVAFCRCKSMSLNGWESLRPYRLGYVKGIKIVEERTAGMTTESVTTLSQAFDKLEHGYSDLVLANRISGLAMLRQKGLGDVLVLQPPLASFPVFHYVNRRHADLVPRLTDALQQMEKDGTAERIRKQVLAGP